MPSAHPRNHESNIKIPYHGAHWCSVGFLDVYVSIMSLLLNLTNTEILYCHKDMFDWSIEY